MPVRAVSCASGLVGAVAVVACADGADRMWPVDGGAGEVSAPSDAGPASPADGSEADASISDARLTEQGPTTTDGPWCAWMVLDPTPPTPTCEPAMALMAPDSGQPLPCEFSFDTTVGGWGPPSGGVLHVSVDCDLVAMSADAGEGWSYGAVPNAIVISGTACERLREGGATKIVAAYCPVSTW
jgi:hypothetical protein